MSFALSLLPAEALPVLADLQAPRHAVPQAPASHWRWILRLLRVEG